MLTFMKNNEITSRYNYKVGFFNYVHKYNIVLYYKKEFDIIFYF